MNSRCEQPLFVTPRRKRLCPNPIFASCERCRIGLCWAHSYKCEQCQVILCQDCKREHPHQKKEMQRVTLAELHGILKAWPA